MTYMFQIKHKKDKVQKRGRTQQNKQPYRRNILQEFSIARVFWKFFLNIALRCWIFYDGKFEISIY